MIRLLAGGLAVGAALWSGAWVYGKGAIRDGVDEQIALMREQGIEASYEAIEIGGFPFGYEGRMIEPRYAMAAPVDVGGGRVETVTYRWSAPWMALDAAVTDLTGLAFAVADDQSLTVTPLDGAPLELSIRSSGLHGRLAMAGNRARLDTEAQSLDMTVVPPPGVEGEPLTLLLSGVVLSGEGPEMEDGIPVAAGFSVVAEAERFSLRSEAVDAPSLHAEAGSMKMSGRMGLARIEADIEASEASLALSGPFPVAIETGPLVGQVSGPAAPSGQPQRLTLSLDVKDADPGATVWDLFDPAGAFPREIGRLRLDAEADAVLAEPLSDFTALLAPDSPLRLQDATINSLIIDAAGVELDAAGSGTVINGLPEGNATLRFTGIDGFMTNAVKAGLMPEQQALVYRLMLKNVARKGEKEGQSVFNLAMKDGLTFVNGVPVGPAPSLPR